MAEIRVHRRLAAILAADVVGYSRLMGADEEGTLARLKALRRDLLDSKIEEHRGRIVKTTGDGLLAEFASVVDALRCAVDIQRGMAERNREVEVEKQIALRIGINVGDIIIDGSDIFGDGVNVAARLEGLADPGGICVSGRVQEDARGKLDVAFEDMGERWLKNIAWPVRVYGVRLGGEVSTARPALALSDKPSIAVLPFVNMSGDSEQEFFADGLTEDIITALSRISNLFVIARTSTFTYKGQPTDVTRVAGELSVRYVMEGSVRRAGDRFRVTAQLIEASTGHHVWADRYDRSVADIFEVQDEITRGVVASTETHVVLAERQVSDLRAPADLRAWDLVTQAWGRLYDLTPEAVKNVAELAEQALRLDPMYPRAHLMRAAAFITRLSMGEIPHDVTNTERALELAKTALRRSPRDEYAHWMLAGAYAEAGYLEDAVTQCERGLQINPNCSLLIADLGDYLASLGRTKEAIEACQLALRLNPRDPSNFWRHSSMATAHFVAAEYEEALSEGKKVAKWQPNFLKGAIIWAAAAAALGRMDDARMAVRDCLSQRPDIRVGNIVPHFMYRFARDADHERLLAMLQKAGLPK